MPSVNIFETLRERVEKNNAMQTYERRSVNWFHNHHKALFEWQKTNDHLTFDRLVDQKFKKRMLPPKNVLPGFMYFFMYMPENASTLPYYDRLPLVMVLERTNTSFLGLNFHYLPYRQRAVLFDLILSGYRNRNADPLKTYVRIKYDILDGVSKYRAFRPCVRRYTYTKCRSALMQVAETDWDLAMFLPVELFTKSVRMDVWNRSMQQVQKG